MRLTQCGERGETSPTASPRYTGRLPVLGHYRFPLQPGADPTDAHARARALVADELPALAHYWTVLAAGTVAASIAAWAAHHALTAPEGDPATDIAPTPALVTVLVLAGTFAVVLALADSLAIQERLARTCGAVHVTPLTDQLITAWTLAPARHRFAVWETLVHGDPDRQAAMLADLRAAIGTAQAAPHTPARWADAARGA